MAENTGKDDKTAAPMTQEEIEALLEGNSPISAAKDPVKDLEIPAEDDSILSADDIDKFFESGNKKDSSPDSSVVEDVDKPG